MSALIISVSLGVDVGKSNGKDGGGPYADQARLLSFLCVDVGRSDGNDEGGKVYICTGLD